MSDWPRFRARDLVRLLSRGNQLEAAPTSATLPTEVRNSGFLELSLKSIMNTTAKIQHKGQVTIPTSVRRQAGLSKGDLVKFTFTRGQIVITPKLVIDRSKFPNADDEYTSAQRRAINARLAKSDEDIKRGRVYGPFDTHQEFLASLHKEAAKLRVKKAKRPAK